MLPRKAIIPVPKSNGNIPNSCATCPSTIVPLGAQTVPKKKSPGDTKRKKEIVCVMRDKIISAVMVEVAINATEAHKVKALFGDMEARKKIPMSGKRILAKKRADPTEASSISIIFNLVARAVLFTVLECFLHKFKGLHIFFTFATLPGCICVQSRA